MAVMVVLSPVSASQGAAIHKAAALESVVVVVGEPVDCLSYGPSCPVLIDLPDSAGFDGMMAEMDPQITGHGTGKWCSEFCVGVMIIDLPDQGYIRHPQDYFVLRPAALALGEQVVPYRPPMA